MEFNQADSNLSRSLPSGRFRGGSTLELLSPAKNLECGKAAIDHGADAVYIGAQRFGARAAAGNSIEDIDELCRYAHQFGAKVFVTVNTIIYDEELDETLTLVKELSNIGVDAILVQDMGLLKILKESSLPLTGGTGWVSLHASTQTDNRTVEKVKFLASQGFKRVVLARELSIDEIREIHEAVPEVELEVFVHGALCVSYSGQCYASQYCFNRSANRGECAQFCRLAFTLKDATGKVIEQDRHLLSLRDMAQLNNLERLADAGAVSFKIEGRLKDVDYVKNITAAYSQKLNEIVKANPSKYRRASFGHCSYTFQPDINKSFNRGFTTYFADGRQKNLVSFDTPKAMGEPVGKVKEIRGRSFNVAGIANFTNGDGLCFLNDKHELVGFRVNKVEGNRLFPLRMPEGIRPGTQLFRNFDKAFNDIISRPTSERKLNIRFFFSTQGNTMYLKAEDECGRTAEATIDCKLSEAKKPQEENIRKVLSKLGDTPFECTDVEINTKDFIPSSILTTLRRNIIDRILNEKICLEGNTERSEINRGQRPRMTESASNNCLKDSTNAKSHHYTAPYLYNASNKEAKKFYQKIGIEDATAFETTPHSSAFCPSAKALTPNLKLMQCRYCLRNEMGYCTKTGNKAPWKEPLTISISDGRTFRLQFDCKNCQMNVLTVRS